MWLKSISNHKKELVFSLFFGLVVTTILWITLLSREPGNPEVYLIPFYSWFQVIKGNGQWFLENLGNILMFVSLGFLLQMMIGDRKKSVLIGFDLSLFIEVVQLITRVGSFEVDDLFHNSLGCFAGAVIFQKNRIRSIDWKKIWKYSATAAVAILVLSISCNVVYKLCHHQKMAAYAALSDLDGKKNLLILDGKDGLTWNRDVYVKYLDDGSLSIKGKTDSRSWYPIGDITLEPGYYVLAGLSGVKRNTVALEIAFYDEELRDYRQIVKDLGYAEERQFELSQRTKVKAYVSVYPGCDCDVIARPVIYKEGD